MFGHLNTHTILHQVTYPERPKKGGGEEVSYQGRVTYPNIIVGNDISMCVRAVIMYGCCSGGFQFENDINSALQMAGLVSVKGKRAIHMKSIP